MKENSVVYVAICSPDTSPGVYKKVLGFAKGAKECGYEERTVTIEPNGYRGYLMFLASIVTASERNVVIRYIPKLGWAIFLLGLVLRLKKRNLIIDVPTPMRNHIKEILLSGKPSSCFSKYLNVSFILCQGFLPFSSATKIIHYAEESAFFTFGLKYKVILIGNSVDVESIPVRNQSPAWPDKKLALVAVGTVAIWHGWDKVINVIKELYDEGFAKFEIYLTIVGDGPELLRLKKMVRDYKLEEKVKFPGFLKGEALYQEYKKAHLGLGSLGWDRIGVTIASPIKNREYLAAGIPFIYATPDVDISSTSHLAYIVPEGESTSDLKHFIKELGTRTFPSASECRVFAIDNLAFKSRVKIILG